MSFQQLAMEPNIPVPTLALNTADRLPLGHFYFFGMALESEARQIARLVNQQGLRQAIVITAGKQLDHRLQFAFEEEWLRLGGVIKHEIDFDNDLAVLANIPNTSNAAIFLAADAAKARMIRPYLPNKLPIYATSQVFAGNSDTLANYDMSGVHFVDMPWLLQADHPAVMTYPRPAAALSTDLERFYALGIDAFRLVQLLLTGKFDVQLDGVSGKIELKGYIFQRSVVPATFDQGQARPSNQPESHGRAPDKPPNQ